jgi:hypothetical protein
VEINEVDMGFHLEVQHLEGEPEIGDTRDYFGHRSAAERPGNCLQKESQWSEPYPGQVAKVLGEAETLFQKWEQRHWFEGSSEWAPFENQQEWELAQWLMKSLGQTSIDEYLKLSIVSNHYFQKQIRDT